MRKNFRFSQFEEKKNIKRAAIFIGLSIFLMSVLFFWGIPTIARVATFISEIGKSDDPITNADHIPPAPPRIEEVPQATNKISVDVKGNTEASATVIIEFNGGVEEILAGVGGEFSKNYKLLKGENSFVLKARDQAGNESQPTQIFEITYDDEEPKLEVKSPEGGSSFFGSGQRQITIQGTTDSNANLTVNDRFVSIADDGSFSFTTTLVDGTNEFTIKSIDLAGNSSEENISVTFNP